MIKHMLVWGGHGVQNRSASRCNELGTDRTVRLSKLHETSRTVSIDESVDAIHITARLCFRGDIHQTGKITEGREPPLLPVTYRLVDENVRIHVEAHLLRPPNVSGFSGKVLSDSEGLVRCEPLLGGARMVGHTCSGTLSALGQALEHSGDCMKVGLTTDDVGPSREQRTVPIRFR